MSMRWLIADNSAASSTKFGFWITLGSRIPMPINSTVTMLVRDVAGNPKSVPNLLIRKFRSTQKPDTAHIGNRSVNDFAVHCVQARGELDERDVEVRNRRHLRNIHLIE